MYIAIVPNRSSSPTILLRRAWREEGKIKRQTVASFSCLPLDQVR